MYCSNKLESLQIKEIDIPDQEISDLKMRLQKCYEAAVVAEDE